DQRIALRSRVLGVAADVEVEASAVLEEHIRRTAPGHDSPEEITGNLIWAEPPLSPQGARDPVLVLQAEDPAFHNASLGHARPLVEVPCDLLAGGELGFVEPADGAPAVGRVVDHHFPAFGLSFLGSTETSPSDLQRL